LLPHTTAHVSGSPHIKPGQTSRTLLKPIITQTVYCSIKRNTDILRTFIKTEFLSCKYSHVPQLHILEHPQPLLHPQHERPRFTPIQKNRKNHNNIYLSNLMSLIAVILFNKSLHVSGVPCPSSGDTVLPGHAMERPTTPNYRTP
jgi:hypothetical protein